MQTGENNALKSFINTCIYNITLYYTYANRFTLTSNKYGLQTFYLNYKLSLYKL